MCRSDPDHDICAAAGAAVLTSAIGALARPQPPGRRHSRREDPEETP